MFRTRGPVVVGVVSLLLLGCTGEANDEGVAAGGDAGGEVDGAAAGDRQPANADPRQRTVEDVTAMLFPVGGPTIRRGARASNVMANAQAKNCGGIIVDIDDTSGRLDQALLADLELIESKGLMEFGDPKADGTPVDGSSALARELQSAELAQQVTVAHGAVDVPSLNDLWLRCAAEVFSEARNLDPLREEWDAVLTRVATQGAVVNQNQRVATCLEGASGIEVDRDAPTRSFLDEADGVLASSEDRSGDLDRLSRAYVGCTAGYFATVRGLLTVEQARMVEANGALIESVAGDLLAAGYSP